MAFENNEKKDEFGYVSPDVQKKSAATILIIEIGVLIIVVIGILLALNYLGIFRISSLFNFTQVKVDQNIGKKGYDPSRAVAISPTPVAVNASIDVVSDIPGHTMTIVNKEKLIGILKGWKVYGIPYDDPNVGSTNGKALANISVHLTSQPQTLFPQSDQNGLNTASSYKASDASLTLLIYISPSMFTDSANINYNFNKQMLFSLEALAIHVDTSAKYGIALNEVKSVLDAQKVDKSYFVIIK